MRSISWVYREDTNASAFLLSRKCASSFGWCRSFRSHLIGIPSILQWAQTLREIFVARRQTSSYARHMLYIVFQEAGEISGPKFGHVISFDVTRQSSHYDRGFCCMSQSNAEHMRCICWIRCVCNTQIRARDPCHLISDLRSLHSNPLKQKG